MKPRFVWRLLGALSPVWVYVGLGFFWAYGTSITAPWAAAFLNTVILGLLYYLVSLVWRELLGSLWDWVKYGKG